MSYDIAVIGGGPAGCAAAITATRSGLRTVLFERGRYPRHKVCGEFISNESHELLVELLGKNSALLQQPADITRARMFADGHCIQFDLHTPAWSITRFDLDASLWNAAQSAGVECHDGTTVESVRREGSHLELTVKGTPTKAGAVINATGRWSNLRRPPMLAGPRWIGLKAHFRGEQAPASTDIYFFPGGYCGVQPIGANLLNASAMVRSDAATSLEQVFAGHPELWTRSRAWEQTIDSLTTSPLVHAEPEPVSDGVMNAGDAAGFIDPFLGDGISLALRSGVLAAQSKNCEAYASEYARRFSKAFETAAFVRRLVYAPGVVRRIAILAFQSELLREFALRRSRGI
jgi:flavin-dependent dehydrogenase